jgi:hypothetical protein
MRKKEMLGVKPEDIEVLKSASQQLRLTFLRTLFLSLH